MTLIRFLLFFLLVTLPALAQSASDSLAFYYGQHQPLAEMTLYSGVVVQPGHISDRELAWLAERQISRYGYLSLGESTEPGARGLMTNRHWQSQIMDLADPAWQQQLLNQARALKARGFDGLFLDTLDSYQQLPEAQQAGQQQALTGLIGQLAGLFGGQLVLNRGFELLPQLQGQAQRVVAEGLFSRYNPLDDSYGTTTADDQAWLTGQLSRARELGFKVQVIDYAQPGQRQAMAQAIVQAGFAPWVSDGQLQGWGRSELVTVPRRVLIPFNSQLQPLIEADVHNRLATLLEYLGYLPDYLDLKDQSLPPPDPALYAGVIVWADDNRLYGTRLTAWLKQASGRLPQLLLGEVPDDTELLRPLGAKLLPAAPAGPYRLTRMSPWLKGEASLPLARTWPPMAWPWPSTARP